MPIQDFLQDQYGDLAVVNGDFAVVGGQTQAENLAGVQQRIGTALRMFLGECFLDERIGVDYLGKILIKNPNPIDVQTELSRTLRAVAGVTSIVSAGLMGPTVGRLASIIYSVRTIYSTQPVTGTVTQ